MLHMYWQCCHVFFFILVQNLCTVACCLWPQSYPSFLCLQLLAYKQHFIHKYRHAYLMYLHTKFHIPTSSGWFVITIKLKAKKKLYIYVYHLLILHSVLILHVIKSACFIKYLLPYFITNWCWCWFLHTICGSVIVVITDYWN